MGVKRFEEFWNKFLFQGVTPETLGLFRIQFGIGLLAFHVYQFHTLLALDIDGPHFPYIAPIWYFDVLGIINHNPALTYGFFALLMVSTAAFAAGLFTRTSMAMLILSLLYMKGARDGISGDVHHRYVIPFNVLLVLAFSKCGHVYSVDNLIQRGRTKLVEWEASWPIKAGQLYICSFYLWSGLAKIRKGGFVWTYDGGKVQEILLRMANRWGIDDLGAPLFGSEFGYELAHWVLICSFLSAATLCMEVGFPSLLIVRNQIFRLVFLLGVTSFHVGTHVVAYVKFALLPIVFPIFFDLDGIFRAIRSRFSAEDFDGDTDSGVTSFESSH